MDELIAEELRRYADKLDCRATTFGEDRGQPFREGAELLREKAEEVEPEGGHNCPEFGGWMPSAADDCAKCSGGER